MTASLRSAARRQSLANMVGRLEAAVPSLADQYTGFSVEGEYLATKVRGQHAFQMTLVEEAVRDLDCVSVVDIGDSSGTHLIYAKHLFGDRLDRCVSVNLDAAAVERIRSKGFEAIHARAEDLGDHGVSGDVGFCFEMLEHLTDPIRFLHAMAERGTVDKLVVTVPYLRVSRVGLGYIRRGERGPVGAERTHVFELSAPDWRYVARFAGWRVEGERTYLQYPSGRPLGLTRGTWRAIDFEGFFGMILTRDDEWSSLYTDW